MVCPGCRWAASLDLKQSRDLAATISWGRLFHSGMVRRKNNIMYVLCPAVGDVVAVCVVHSLAWSVGCGKYTESMVTRRRWNLSNISSRAFLRRFWSVGQARELIMYLTQEVWWCIFVTHLDARRWTFSIVFISFAECGSQRVAEYSRIRRIKALYAVSLVFLFPIFKLLLRKPSDLFALLVMMSMWSPHFSLSWMFLPRYFLCWRFAGCVHVGGMTVQFFFLSFG